MKILFIDKDGKCNGTLYPLLAKKNNAEYKIAYTCPDAKKLIREGFLPDFVILEYDIPPGNGMDVIMYLQTLENADKIKVFLTTDLQDYRKIESLADSLSVTFERKPLSLLQLQKFIDG
jgi:DNA-binding NtrC family response regulator